MPRRNPSSDLHALSLLAERDDGIVTYRELAELGIAASTATHRCRPGGPWQRLLPGVMLTSTGTPTNQQRLRASLKYAGDDAVLSGRTVLGLAGIPTPKEATVHVLVPHARRRASVGFVRIERTRSLPGGTQLQHFPCATVARALVDAGRHVGVLRDVRDLTAQVVQRGLVTPEAIAHEVRTGQRRQTARTRLALLEIHAGIRSVAEGDASRLLTRYGVAQPRWNVTLVDEFGNVVAVVDGWYAEAAVALEIDSMAWHASPESYKRTQRRQALLASLGVTVIPVAPGDLRRNPAAFAALVERTLAAAGHPTAQVHAA